MAENLNDPNSGLNDLYIKEELNEQEEFNSITNEMQNITEVNDVDIKTMGQQSTESSIKKNDMIRLEKLKAACLKRGSIDGKYFQVDYSQSSLNGTIYGICQMCTTKRVIRASSGVTSNFATHVKRLHPHLFEEYKAYCKWKRSAEPKRSWKSEKMAVLDLDLENELTEKESVDEDWSPSKRKELHNNSGNGTDCTKVLKDRISEMSSDIDTTEQERIKKACTKIACLDGKYFKVNLSLSNNYNGSIFATCQNCYPEKNIKGSLHVTSNFVTHLKKLHPNIFEEYKTYVSQRKSRLSEAKLDQNNWMGEIQQSNESEPSCSSLSTSLKSEILDYDQSLTDDSKENQFNLKNELNTEIFIKIEGDRDNETSTHNKNSDEEKLRNVCMESPCFDGTYFKVDYAQSKYGGVIVAICQLCQATISMKGFLKTNDNFVIHLKNVHWNVFEEYLDYVNLKQAELPSKRLRRSCSFNQDTNYDVKNSELLPVKNEYHEDDIDDFDMDSDEGDINDQYASGSEMVYNEINEKKLVKECQRRAYLDGKFFRINLQKSFQEGDPFKTVVALCVNCPEGNNEVRGHLKVSSNFLKHLKAKHPDKKEQYNEYRLKKRMSVRENPEDSKEISCTFSQKQFDENVMNYILQSGAPLQTVEMPTFQAIFDDINRGFKGSKRIVHMNKSRILRRIEEKHDRFIEMIADLVAIEADYVCSTVDLWSCKSYKFLGITLHWIKPNSFERRSEAVACRRFKEFNLNEQISEIISDVHKSLKIPDEKLVATITNNSSNFVTLFNEFGIDLGNYFYYDFEDENSSCRFEDNDFDDTTLVYNFCTHENFNDIKIILPHHFKCSSYILNLICSRDAFLIIHTNQDLYSMHQITISRCQKLWNLLCFKSNRQQIIEKFGITIKLPVATQWTSLYYALEQLFLLKEKMNEICKLLKVENIFYSKDYDYIVEYLKSMFPLVQALNLLEGEGYCHYGYLLPTLISTRRKLQAILANNSIYHCLPLVEGLLKYIEHRFSAFYNIEDTSYFAVVAAVTHPKFKASWIGCLDPNLQNKIQRMVINAAQEMSGEKDIINSLPKRSKLDDFDFGEEVGSFSKANVFGSRQSKSEIEVLNFTQDHRNNLEMLHDYPLIKKLFILCNTPLSSSGPVERIFNFATKFNSSNMRKLSDIHFETRALFKANYKKN